MQAVELIRKKRDGGILSTAEIDWLVEQYTHEQIPDYQMSAWLMTVYEHGMNARETSDLTLAMARSGEQLHVRDTISPVVDKHSTGGVGDKVTLAVAPLVAACGVAVGKMTGRGLGHTGGTVDKLESIAGFRSALSREEFMRILTQHHIVLAGQSSDLAPADGKMYALRDVTGTVESIPLIAASIMSKKLAIGASHLLLDVKVGSGAFMKNVEQARELARTMVDIGGLAGLHTVAAITSMEQPLGHAIGNALEMAEAIAILHGQGPQDVSALCFHEALELLVMTGTANTMSEAECPRLRSVLSRRFVQAQPSQNWPRSLQHRAVMRTRSSSLNCCPALQYARCCLLHIAAISRLSKRNRWVWPACALVPDALRKASRSTIVRALFCRRR